MTSQRKKDEEKCKIAPWRAHRYSERHGLQTATVLNAVVLVAARAGRVACKRCTVSVQCGPIGVGFCPFVGHRLADAVRVGR